jgi:2-keto-3-deoxy-L-fuconate dehydrogenase
MLNRLAGRRVVVTDCNEFMGPDVAALFVEEGAEVFADARDLTQPNAAGDFIQEAGHVDVRIANLAFSYY